MRVVCGGETWVKDEEHDLHDSWAGSAGLHGTCTITLLNSHAGGTGGKGSEARDEESDLHVDGWVECWC